ncbi:nucleoside-diphosphate sugar epimerase/dehydratase [Tissierella sp. MB52-C2]|uniref:polysaccharide biosynthesis protein n=1 Tax=Tissierella sp. MB52-C2 TaxID=3070999 RepID=UPI00280B9DD3|nr:nucleoside-diphosphate sugar epimerase/dehydratase [Tissierella sp. MB52-C2]WMM24317.1 nucleoside-diphosphate sugar epimerase/dehydratase [Tissierella sp. MB52-C2]
MGKKRSFILFILDTILINISYILSLYIRFEGDIVGTQFLEYFTKYKEHFIYITVIKLVIFLYFKLYKSVWKYASIEELINIVVASIVSNAAILSYMFIMQSNLPRSIYILATLLDMVLIGGIRFSSRAVNSIGGGILNRDNQKKIMIIGGGDAGAMVIREYKNHTQLNSKPVAIIDDSEKKQGQMINGVQVVGKRIDIPTVAEKLKIDEIIIAMPSASKKEIRDIVEISKTTKAKLKIVPGMFELIDGKVSIKNIREVDIEDLLGREEIKTDLKEISSYITNKTVLVTGGGGSIGSELCRQIANFSPKKLVILDIYENNAYDIQNELLRKHKDLNLRTVIASIRDKDRIVELMNNEKPQVVFHAAAHKHVPLMEDSPKEAIKNNVFGTLNLAQAADKAGVDKFVMISTDKAVNPTNIMGASKRMCEMIIQSMNSVSKTDFVAVRFGNVLGSNGSVIPLFKKQIAEGGPVTVTHKDVIRYFMTIPEAVQLVIQAGAMANGGEIFILDMGEPVRIIDLAKDLIRLSGFEPDVDIPIVITGLRPGEKLFEELLLDEEGLSATKHDKIFIGKPTFTDYKLLLRLLESANRIIKIGTDEDIKNYVKTIVPNYRENNEENHNDDKKLAKSEI